MQLIPNLKKYGLTENEAEVYVALFRLVEASVYQIASMSGVPRGTTYHTLNDLKIKGFISEFKKRNVKYFVAEPPSTLVKILQQKNEIAKLILPQLVSLSQNKELKPDVSLFIGKEGIKRVYSDILQTLKQKREKQLSAIAQPQIIELLPRFFPEWITKRKKLDISSKLILPDTQQGHDIALNYTEQRLGEIRFMPKDYIWEGAVNIYGNKVALFSFNEKELSAVIIENQTIHTMFRNFFEFNWNSLK